MNANVPTAIRPDPPRGEGTFYARGMDPDVLRELHALAGARGWTLAQVVAQLVELRRGALAIAVEYPNVIGEPVRELLHRLQLEPRAV